MEGLVVHVDGIGWWSSGAADWSAAAPLLRTDPARAFEGAARPVAAVLAPQERRRAPEPVLIACEVSTQACTMAACDPASVPCVFASAHGDTAITDALCTALASDPLQVSPTRFHNSVHNAPAGYWTIATQCHAPSSAVSAWHGSFAAGMFDAAVQAHADATPVLFAIYDIAARGPLAEVLDAHSPFGAAVLLNPQRGPRTLASLHLSHAATQSAASDIRVDPILGVRALFAALARGEGDKLHLSSGASSALTIEVCA